MIRTGLPITVASALLVGPFLGPGAPAADDRVIERSEPAPEEGEIVLGGNVRLIGAQRPLLYDLGQLFDQQVFGRPMRPFQAGAVVIVNGAVVRQPEPPPSAEQADNLAAVRRRGARYVATLERVCRLEADQSRRLRIALESDLKRLAGEIAAVRSRYAGGKAAAPQAADRELLTALRADAQACRQRLDAALGPGSLVAAVGRDVLEPGQEAAFDEWLAERRACRWRAVVGAVLLQLDESGLGLSQRQFTALEQGLLSEVPALEVMRDSTAPGVDGRLVRFQVPLVLSRLGRQAAAWRPLVDPRQRARLEGLIEQAGDPAAVERLLVSQGILEETVR